MENPPRTEPPRGDLSAEAKDEALKQILASGLVVPLPMTGDAESMMPTVRPGERVAVERSGDRPERGDLLLFRQVDYRVVHRCLGWGTGADGSPCLRMRGDNNPTLDAPVDPSRVLGRVVAVERDGEWWDLDSPAARLYGLGAALHALFWSVAARAAGRLEAALGRRGGKVRERVVECDRRLLRLAYRLLQPLGRRRRVPLSGRPDAG